MKQRIAVFSVLFCCLLTIHSYAQPACTSPNVIGLFGDDGAILGSQNFVVPSSTPFTAYVVLMNPEDNYGNPVSEIEAFEFTMTFSNPSMLFKLAETLPPQAINVCDSSSPVQGLGYCVGLGYPTPVVNGNVTLIQFTFMVLTPYQNDVFIEESYGGNIYYQEATNRELVDMYPTSGNTVDPVASFNGIAILDCDDGPPPPTDISVQLSFQGDNANTAGTAQGATDGYDVGLDIPDQNLALTFPHPEWNSPAGDNFSRDLKELYDPTQDVKQWQFVTRTNFDQTEGGQTVTIDFSPSFASNEGIGLKLYDHASGQEVNLFPNLVYSYYAQVGTDSRTFDLKVGTFDPGPTALSVGIDAYATQLSDTGTMAATAEGATDGYDPGVDTPNPAPPPANYLQVSFNQPGWPLGPRFENDVRAIYDPGSETKTWPFMVETDQAGFITLDFLPSFDSSSNIWLGLRDLRTGQTYSLFPDLTYTFQSYGMGTYYFELYIGSVVPPELDPDSRAIPEGWSLVGMPLLPEPGQDTLDDVIKGLAPGYAYMFEYLGATGYGNLDGTETANYGQGYWIGTDQGFTWTMSGDIILDPIFIPMDPGWNLIGNPMWFPGPVENIQVQYGGTTYDWQNAVVAGLVSNTVYDYDPVSGQYVNTLDMVPWHGYWVNALTSGVLLVYEWDYFLRMPSRFVAGEEDIMAGGLVWETEIKLTDVAENTRVVTIGLNEDATLGYDSVFDLPQPPASPNGGPILAIQRPEWKLTSGNYFTADFQPPHQEEVHWNLQASVPEQGYSVLHWDSSDWPKGMDYQLYNPDQNRVVVMSMRFQNAYVMQLEGGSVNLVVRTPNMLSGLGDTPGLAFGLEVYPNPFNPMTTINFEMAKSGTAEIRIYSLRGELISSLVGRHYEAGSHKTVWQGKDRAGRNVPSGSYFAKLFVDGEAKGEVIKMSLIR
jgi:hypothetical protein